MNTPLQGTQAFEHLRALASRSPEGTLELLPIIEFLETFPHQSTEEELIHLVGVTALGMAKARQGGIWDGGKWLFLRGLPCPDPSRSVSDWCTLPWEGYAGRIGHLVLKVSEPPRSLFVLLAIAAPLLYWRRLEGIRTEQNRALALQLGRLNTLLDLTHAFGEVEQKEALLHLAATTIMGEFMIPRLLLVSTEGQVLFNRGAGRLPDPLPADLPDYLAQRGLGLCLEFRDAKRNWGQAFVACPASGELNPDDRIFLETLLNLTASHLTKLELQASREASRRMEKDLDLARNIQQRNLPKKLPEPQGWECSAANLPYQAVGGDLFNLWTASDPWHCECMHLAVADISGKGLPASLMMTQLAAVLRVVGDHWVDDWGQVVGRLNERMNEVREGNRYATLFVGGLDPATGQLRYVNAAHNPALLISRKENQVLRLEPTGPMVGLLPGAVYREDHCMVEPGDVLLVFTDGLSEAPDEEDRELGDEALIEVVREHPEASADELMVELLTSAFRQVERSGFRDDVTLVVLKRKEKTSATPNLDS